MVKRSKPIKPPTGFYPSTWGWIVGSNLQASPLYYHKFGLDHEPKVYAHPKGSEDPLHWKFVAESKRRSPPTFLVVIPNGRVWGANGAVITPDNKLLWTYLSIMV